MTILYRTFSNIIRETDSPLSSDSDGDFAYGVMARRKKKPKPSKDPRDKQRRIRPEGGQSGSRSAGTITRVDFFTQVWKQIKIEHFDDGDEKQIRVDLMGMLNLNCDQAFQAAGLRSPTSIVLETGLVIRPSNDLFTSSADQLGLVSDLTRGAYARDFSSQHAQEGTIPSGRDGGALTTDGKPQIYLHQRAFMGYSFWDGRYSLRGVLSHAFIHAAGRSAMPGHLGFLRHDLAGFAPHDSILAACEK